MNNPSDHDRVVSRAFATRARTIDHLGREQIADCPTAISELWKNSWDAYARNVRLRLFAEETPVAVLVDDGHGMREQDLFERWLVIGTESKISDIEPALGEDRNGLPIRARQGQKGIGRLSSAKLGSIILLITKHKRDIFHSALIDWRMFENPYINLSDVVVATGSFQTKQEIFDEVPSFADALMASVLEKPKELGDRETRLRDVWARYDKEWLKENLGGGPPPSTRIIQGMKRLPFHPDHLADWDGPGTAMLVYDLDDTLRALPSTGDTDLIRTEALIRFQRTLSNFVDPYTITTSKPNFSYRAEICAQEGEQMRTKVIVGAEKAVDRTQVQEMEHQIDGTVGDDGVFRGKIRAFGAWIDGKVEFELPSGLAMPDRASSRVGSFDLYIASMEFDAANSTHPRAEHDRYLGLATDYSGLMIYRDSLRVLPYGREDNDFFEIEFKRSKNAGRYFWNHRQMFGRIALSRHHNPNLRDKAGREGFIDNTAAKTFRAIVGNILDQSARRFFGSASEIRKPRIAEIKSANRAGRAEQEAKKLRERERKQFQLELEQAEKILPSLRESVERQLELLTIKQDRDVSYAAAQISDFRSQLADASIRPQPSGTARLNSRYQAAVIEAEKVSEALENYQTKFQKAIDTYNAAKPAEIIATQIAGSISTIQSQIATFQQQIETLQREQYNSVRQLAARRLSEFRSEIQAAGSKYTTANSDFGLFIQLIENLRNDWEHGNRDIFGIYISALESVRDQIDLETLASIQLQDLREASVELDRLTSLAQLGIAVEIAAHDLADFDEMANSGLRQLPDEIRNTPAVRDIQLGLDGLTDQLRFLSPLRLSGDKIQRWIDGTEIASFVEKFFAPTLTRAGIEFEPTDKFKRIRLYERPARVFPVFLNLVNNSIYWLGTVPRATRKIFLDVLQDEVVVADTGPGVSEEDKEQLFKLFFTRKQRSGRGVGLYLARTNLAAGGHEIRYKNRDDDVALSGAAFFIKFRDADLGGSIEP